MDDHDHDRTLQRARRRVASARRGARAAGQRPPGAADIPLRYVVTTPTLPGAEVATSLGLVSVSVARANHAFRDVATAWRDDFGGRMGAFGKLVDEARNEAVNDLRTEAAGLGADAIVGVRIDVTAPTTSVLVVTATGTAVTLDLTDTDDAVDAVTPAAETPDRQRTVHCEACGAANVITAATASMISCSGCGVRTPVA